MLEPCEREKNVFRLVLYSSPLRVGLGVSNTSVRHWTHHLGGLSELHSSQASKSKEQHKGKEIKYQGFKIRILIVCNSRTFYRKKKKKVRVLNCCHSLVANSDLKEIC